VVTRKSEANMAIDRGTRRATFVNLIEACAMIGALGGAAWGVYQLLGENPFEVLMSAIRFGFFGFIGGTVAGIALGILAVIYITIFK
jgi:hypothetical protein